MIGDFLRECAALIVVFVPLELWHDQATRTADFVWHVAEACFVSFAVGVIFEYLSLLAIE